MKDKNILLKGLSKFVDERNIKKVRLLFKEFHASDIHEEVKNWPIEKVILLIRLLKEEEAAEIFAEFTSEHQEQIINALTSTEIAEIFEELYTDEAIDILDDLPHKITRRVLKVSDSKTREKINSILRYDKNEVGYHMVVDYVAIPLGITIGKAKELISDQIENDDLEIVGNIHVYDKNTSEYIGYITPADVISQDPKIKIDTLVERIEPIRTNDDMNIASEKFERYDLTAFPVVNSKNKFVGLIEADDIIERYRDVGNAVLDQVAIKAYNKKYFDITVWESFKSRIPWIVSLFIIGTLTQIIILLFQNWWISIGFFESGGGAIASIGVMAIATCLSLSSSITGSAGNTGSQTSATLVRALALDEIQKDQYMKAFWKELKISFWIGLVIALTAFIRIFIIWFAFGNIYSFTGKGWISAEWALYLLLIASITSISFLLTIVLGNIVGCSLPLIGAKNNWDGAIFSGPVQATVVDVLTILIYFSLTTIIFVILKNSGAIDGLEPWPKVS